VTYVYAICDIRPGEGVNVRGIGGREVHLQTWGGITIACSDLPASAVPVTPENVLAHERVLESLMGAGTVLPSRFGTTFHRAADLDAVLARNAERLRAGLDRVRDCEEWGVRVLWQQPDPGPGGCNVPSAMPAASGREYMLRRAAEEQRRQARAGRAEELAGQLHAQLATAAVDSARKVLATPDLLLSGAYLVRRERADEFQDRVRHLAAAHPDLRVLGTGPWPPYHFTPALDTPEPAHA
jgi:hypothetical protein